jgi:hypothetical protein
MAAFVRRRDGIAGAFVARLRGSTGQDAAALGAGLRRRPMPAGAFPFVSSALGNVSALRG